MNYKDKLLNYIEEGKSAGIELFQEEGKPTATFEKAFDLTFQILKKRFENELKLHNNDEEKAYDQFVARRNLDYLRIYIQEFILLDKEAPEIDFYKAVRKYMRDLLNNLYVVVLRN